VTEPDDRGDGADDRGSTAHGRRPSGGDDLRPARDSFWALVPRRELYKAGLLLLLLVVVIALRVRAVPLAQAFRDTLFPHQAPRVRLAPLPEPRDRRE
jgi:hypothetical protein